MADQLITKAIRRSLAERGVTVPEDEVAELAAAHSALLEWIFVIEELAASEAAFEGLPPATE